METSNSKNNVSEFRGGGSGASLEGPLVMAIIALAIAVLAFFVIVYGLVLGLSAGAIYLGVKLGSAGQIHKKSYEHVKDREREKQEHLGELEGESDDLRELVVQKFEQEKMDHYRPAEDRPEPLINLTGEALKDTAKKIIKKAMGRG